MIRITKSIFNVLIFNPSKQESTIHVATYTQHIFFNVTDLHFIETYYIIVLKNEYLNNQYKTVTMSKDFEKSPKIITSLNYWIRENKSTAVTFIKFENMNKHYPFS